MKIEINLVNSDFVIKLHIIAHGVGDDEMQTVSITWCGAKLKPHSHQIYHGIFHALQSEALIRGIAGMQNCHVC